MSDKLRKALERNIETALRRAGGIPRLARSPEGRKAIIRAAVNEAMALAASSLPGCSTCGGAGFLENSGTPEQRYPCPECEERSASPPPSLSAPDDRVVVGRDYEASRRKAVEALAAAPSAPRPAVDEGAYRARQLHPDVRPGFNAVVDDPTGWPICHCARLDDAEKIAAALSAPFSTLTRDAKQALERVIAALARRSIPTMDPHWSAAFNAALDMVEKALSAPPLPEWPYYGACCDQMRGEAWIDGKHRPEWCPVHSGDGEASYEQLAEAYVHMRDMCRQAQDGWNAERRKLWAAEARLAATPAIRDQAFEEAIQAAANATFDTRGSAVEAIRALKGTPPKGEEGE